MEEKIYLDYNATTPLDPNVKAEIIQSLDFWGNPSSSHELGCFSKRKIDLARDQIACAVGANASDIVFTSGGTEANNQVLHTAVHHLSKNNSSLPHIVTTNVEHPAISEPLQELEKRHICTVTYVPVDRKTGAVTPEAVVAACRKETVLVSVMLANNETGVIQPLPEIVQAVKEAEKKLGNRIYIHTDAAQGIIWKIRQLLKHHLSKFSLKKEFYGPRIGALYVRDLSSGKIPLSPMLFGGGQERGYRPGTENTPMICGLGLAAQLASEIDYSQLEDMRNKFETLLKQKLGSDHVHVNFEYSKRLPSTASVAFPGFNMTSSELLKQSKTFIASTGAACHSGQILASKILLASGLSEELAERTVRFSLGKCTKESDLEIVADEIKKIVLNQ